MGPYTEDDFVLDLRDAEVPGTAGAFAFFFGDAPDARTFTSSSQGDDMGSTALRYQCEQSASVRSVHHTGIAVPPWPGLSDTSPAGVERWAR
ncbi:hypothetical protein [Streptomyces sp. NPDC048637]|uniref:hypothetical protein n=1 Tax=Streptomyces sp. NPDC048637 TaxID=3155636 RepID=UPI003421D014